MPKVRYYLGSEKGYVELDETPAKPEAPKPEPPQKKPRPVAIEINGPDDIVLEKKEKK